MGSIPMGVLTFLAVVAIPYVYSQEFFYQLPTPYSYACLNETCSRDKNPEDSPLTQSLAKCRLLCGEYRSLWPRPTGPVDLSDELVSFKPQRYKISQNISVFNQHIHKWTFSY